MATVPARYMVKHIEPLILPKLPRFRGLDMRAAITMISLPTIALYVYMFMLAPVVHVLEEVQFELCGGNRDFVWTKDARNMIAFSPTKAFMPSATSMVDLRMMEISEAIYFKGD